MVILLQLYKQAGGDRSDADPGPGGSGVGRRCIDAMDGTRLSTLESRVVRATEYLQRANLRLQGWLLRVVTVGDPLR